MQPEARRQFRIGACLGRGGFGEVYRATQRSPGGLETPVALKVLRSDLELDEAAIGRLRDEGRLLARISHPVVVRAYDLVSVEGRIGLVTEFVDGDDLDACMKSPGRIEVRALVQVVGQVAAALDAAFTTIGPDGQPLRIVHRDVKLTNVRIGRHGQVKLLDFGIARFQAPDREARTISDVVVGSVAYMAPERFVERASLPAGDVFGLGCCLYEGAVGHRYHQDSGLRTVSGLSLDADRYARHLSDSLDELDTPAALSELIGACLAFDPAARPTAGELSVRCEALSDRLSGSTLRRWCADRSWAPAPAVVGELEGRTLVEGDLAIAPPATPTRPPGRPRFVQRPLGTIDPDGAAGYPGGAAGFEGTVPGDPLPGAPPLSAPPGFPSLPVGVALLEGPSTILNTDSASRPRHPESSIPLSSRRGSAALLLLGCAVAGLGSVVVLVAGGLLGVWLGLG